MRNDVGGVAKRLSMELVVGQSIWSCHVEDIIGDVCVDPSSDVDKVKFLLHACGHSSRETSKLFSKLFFERSTSPSAHFLYLSIGVSRKQESIGASTAMNEYRSVQLDTLF